MAKRFNKYFTAEGYAYYVDSETNASSWERPSGYYSDEDPVSPPEPTSTEEVVQTIPVETIASLGELPNVELWFHEDVELISELKRMGFINATVDEVRDILSGVSSEHALKKLKLLQSQLGAFGSEAEWTAAVEYDNYNLLQFLLIHMNSSVHADIKEGACRCLAFLTNIYPSLWFEYLRTSVSAPPPDETFAFDKTTVTTQYILFNVLLLFHAGVYRVATQSVEMQTKQAVLPDYKGQYIGFDERDVKDFNMRHSIYENSGNSRPVPTHGIIGMEDVDNDEASVRVWLLLLTQVLNYPFISLIFSKSKLYNISPATVDAGDFYDSLTSSDYAFPLVEYDAVAMHTAHYHEWHSVHPFMLESAQKINSHPGIADAMYRFYDMIQGCLAGFYCPRDDVDLETDVNSIIYHVIFRKLLVRCSDILLRHSKYLSTDSYPLCIKLIAAVHYQLSEQVGQVFAEPSIDMGASLEIVDLLMYLNNQDADRINISELFLHTLNESGYPHHNVPDTIPCLQLCSDLIQCDNLRSLLTPNHISYFYTNDVAVIVGVVTRELLNMPSINLNLSAVDRSVLSCMGTQLELFNNVVKLKYIELAKALINLQSVSPAIVRRDDLISAVRAVRSNALLALEGVRSVGIDDLVASVMKLVAVADRCIEDYKSQR